MCISTPINVNKPDTPIIVLEEGVERGRLEMEEMKIMLNILALKILIRRMRRINNMAKREELHRSLLLLEYNTSFLTLISENQKIINMVI